MEPRRITAHQESRAGRRLVLISSNGPAVSASTPPLRIVGTEPRASGGFRLTDR
jgi:hypothetical protein